MVREVNDKATFDELIKGDAVVIVDFYATWCGPCVAIAPFLKQMDEAHGSEKLIFIKVDVDKATDITKFAGIRAMPTFKAYKGGKEIKEIVGADKKKLQALIDEHK